MSGVNPSSLVLIIFDLTSLEVRIEAVLQGLPRVLAPGDLQIKCEERFRLLRDHSAALNMNLILLDTSEDVSD